MTSYNECHSKFKMMNKQGSGGQIVGEHQLKTPIPKLIQLGLLQEWYCSQGTKYNPAECLF